MPQENLPSQIKAVSGCSDQCNPLHVCPDLILLQRSLPLPLQPLQLQHGCLQVSLLGQLLGHQLLLLSLGLRQHPLLLQVDLLQLCPLGCLLLQQAAMGDTAMMSEQTHTNKNVQKTYTKTVMTIHCAVRPFHSLL